jgi:SAM-dependent methyltransferase/uncharacterized protein YbaR (Trm112 family)
VKLGHFEALRPICPACRKGDIFLKQVIRGTSDEVEEGLLECRSCQHLFPVIEGIPLLVRDLRRMVSEQILSVLERDDLSETTLALLGECCGPGSPFDVTRQRLSSYLSGHYEEGSVVRVLEAGLALSGGRDAHPTGPILDVGCSVGRTTLELGARGLTVGVDLNFSMLRVARRIARTGKLAYPRRSSGLLYEERSLDVPRPHAGRVDFWCADALSLPFREQTFGLATSLNLLDVIAAPLEHLKGMRDVLRPGGAAIVASPFEWTQATPVELWIGGHTPHGPARGSPVEVLRALVGTEHLKGLAIEAERDGLEWPVRVHDRAEMRYRVALFVLRKLPLAP